MKHLVLAACFAAAGWASAGAHVIVLPDAGLDRTPACGFTKFVVRVPTEKPIPTVGLRVRIPASVTAIAVRPKAGWHADFETRKGRVVAIAWSGGRIMPREFEEFAILAAGPKTAMTVSWDAEQTYADKSVVRWTGNPGTDTPHSQTVFTAPAGPCAR